MLEDRGLLRGGAQGDQGWFDVFVRNDGRATYDEAAVTVRIGSRSLGTKTIAELEGGDDDHASFRLPAGLRKELLRKGTLRAQVTVRLDAGLGMRDTVKQAVAISKGGDSRYDGEWRGPGPFVLTIRRGAIRSVSAQVLGYCPETARQQALNIFTIGGFPVLIRKDGSFDATGTALSQSNTYRGRLSLRGTGKGYASAFKTHMNLSSGGRFVLEGCTGATTWTVKRVRR